MGKCFTQIHDSLFAIINWHCRKNFHDAALLTRLNEDQEVTYRSLKESGTTESNIFSQMFPPSLSSLVKTQRIPRLSAESFTLDRCKPLSSEKVTVDINILSKTQLSILVCN